MSLAKRLKEAREDKEWRKVDLMRAAKLKSASTLTELENETITESPQIPAIAEALGVEVMWLKYGKGQKHRPASKDIDISETAFKIAVAVNAMPPEYQTALLHLITLDYIKKEGMALTEIQQLGEEKRLAAK